jgi:hypothetical protein
MLTSSFQFVAESSLDRLNNAQKCQDLCPQLSFGEIYAIKMGYFETEKE